MAAVNAQLLQLREKTKKTKQKQQMFWGCLVGVRGVELNQAGFAGVPQCLCSQSRVWASGMQISMLSARSVAEFCRKEAARFAAISRCRASCRCLSGRSSDRSRATDFPLRVFFGTGGGGFSISDSRGEKHRGKRSEGNTVLYRNTPRREPFCLGGIAFSLDQSHCQETTMLKRQCKCRKSVFVAIQARKLLNT